MAASAAATVAVAVTAVAQAPSPTAKAVDADVVAPATEERVTPAPVPEQVLSAIAPASFNLPTLPPIPEKAAEADATIVVTEASYVAPVSPAAAVIVHAQPAPEVTIAESVAEPAAALTPDVTASATHAPEPVAPIEAAPVVTVASTTIDFRAHLDTAPHSEPAIVEPSTIVTAPEVATIQPQPEAPVEGAPVMPTAPAQGDLLAHAELPHEPAHVVIPEKPATDVDADTVKKDASHG
jgi:ribonuclease E